MEKNNCLKNMSEGCFDQIELRKELRNKNEKQKLGRRLHL